MQSYVHTFPGSKGFGTVTLYPVDPNHMDTAMDLAGVAL